MILRRAYGLPHKPFLFLVTRLLKNLLFKGGIYGFNKA